jgi:hypothetical protein
MLHDKLIYINNRIKGVQAISYDNSSGVGKSINELIDEKTRVIEQMEEIEDAIDNVEDDTLSMLLGYRFLFCYTVEKTANEMGYSVSWINQLTKKAIKSVGKCMVV